VKQTIHGLAFLTEERLKAPARALINHDTASVRGLWAVRACDVGPARESTIPKKTVCTLPVEQNKLVEESLHPRDFRHYPCGFDIVSCCNNCAQYPCTVTVVAKVRSCESGELSVEVRQDGTFVVAQFETNHEKGRL
jgi:hypothetical protein